MIPSLLQIPSAVSDSKLHSVLPNNGKGDFQFDRSTGATRINKDGLIEEVGYFSSELVQNGNFSELGSELVTNGDFATNSDWSITNNTGTETEIINGYLRIKTDGAYTQVVQSSGLTVGKTYKIVYDVIESDGGSLGLETGGATSLIPSTVGTHTFYWVSNRTTLNIKRYGGALDIKIDNVSVKQVDPNDRWTVTSSTSDNYVEFGDGEARIVLGTTSPLTLFENSGTFESGKQYKLVVDIKTVTSGAIKIDGAGISELFNTAGVTTRIINPTANSNIIFYRASVPADITLNSVSLVEVQGDRPRLSYDITNGVVEDKPHLLLEPSSTNLVTFSEDFTQWASTQVSLEKNYLAPDGLLNAVKITDNSVNSTHRVLLGTTSSSSGSFTYSIFLKKGTITNAVLNVFSSGTVAVGTIDLQNGTIVASSGGINAKIQNYGNDWYKCSVSGSLGSTSTTVYLYLSDTKNAYVGSGDFLYAYGAQLEELSYSTSYIPTAGTTITRAAETCNNSKPSVNSTEGVLYAEIAALADDLQYEILSVSDGSTNNRAYLQYTNVSNQIKFVYKVGGVTKAGIGTATFDIVNFHKIACKWKANDFALWIDGNEVGTDTNGSVNSAGTFTKVNFDDGAGNTDFYGKVKGLAVYNEALSESQLMQLTGVTASSIYSNFVTRTASFTVEALNEVKKVIDNL